MVARVVGPSSKGKLEVVLEAIVFLQMSLFLEVLADLILLIEEVGGPPLRILVIVLLAKPDGGRRPIGLLTGLMRVWGKLRRRYAKDWELLRKET